ncbi:MAG: arsenate reductase (azurin) small subunit [Bacteroidota bacterium]
MDSKLSRRNFLKLGGVTSAGVATLGLSHPSPAAQGEVGRATLPYPPKTIAKAKALKPNVPVSFQYPDAASPCVLVKMGSSVPGGVGPDKDIVAYSVLCTHMGCQVSYEPQSRTFKCPCHFSMFDAEKTGQMVTGQATENLPQILLEYHAQDDSVRAVAVNGLIYGRQSNIL